MMKIQPHQWYILWGKVNLNVKKDKYYFSNGQLCKKKSPKILQGKLNRMVANAVEQSIKYASDCRHQLLDQMQQETRPIYIYGTGGYALGLLRFLQNYNIELAGACVDKEFINDRVEWNGLHLLALEDVPRDSAFLIGFADYKKAEARLDANKIRQYYFLDSVIFGLDFITSDFVDKNKALFEQTLAYCHDIKSRNIFVAYVNSKLKGRPDTLYSLVSKDQYYPADLFALSDNEVFVDGGAYDGDTVVEFVKNTNNQYQQVYAFEPDASNFEKLKNINDKRICAINAGLWSSAGELQFNKDQEMGTRSSIYEKGDAKITVTSIDETIEDHWASLIKLDIEGAELEALKGARQTIMKSKPRLAICVYHRPEDLITIPQFIKSIEPGYKIYLRHHLELAQELVLYAIFDSD